MIGIDVVQAINVAGMDDIEYAKSLIEKTKAKKIQNCRLLVRREADGSVKVEQNADDFIEVEDNATQMRALELIGDFKKVDYARKNQIKDIDSGGPTAIQININLTDESKDVQSHANAAPEFGVQAVA